MEKFKSFLSPEEKKAIEEEISKAESKTSGEIRVHLIGKPGIKDAMPVAKKWFVKLKMHKTRDRNGILLLVAPVSRKFAILGDKAINEKIGDNFWSGIRDRIQSSFSESKYATGIIMAVKETGAILEKFFPIKPDDVNELSNEITESN